LVLTSSCSRCKQPSFLIVSFKLTINRYGSPFITHTYLHHVTRIDHRHNFSPYNIQLYLASASPASSGLRIESVAFIPQLLLSCVLIPLIVAKSDLPASMLAQTFAFVTFNKVCTSQVYSSLHPR
jgi:phosphatidylinositol glycan class M